MPSTRPWTLGNPRSYETAPPAAVQAIEWMVRLMEHEHGDYVTLTGNLEFAPRCSLANVLNIDQNEVDRIMTDPAVDWMKGGQ